MVQLNFAKREVQCKVVYYGPARSGKTANLRSIHERTPDTVRGALTSIATDADRTLFFDFLPLNLGLVAGIGTKINLYAVPYIQNQNANRLLVLEGIDGIVFVADRSPEMVMENVAALENLEENLAGLGRDIADIPMVFQWNKSDREDATPVEELESKLNPKGHPSFEATADAGLGVFPCLKSVTQAVLLNVSQVMTRPDAEPAAAPEPVPEPAPTPAASRPAVERPIPIPVTPAEEEVLEPWAEEIAEAPTDEFEPAATAAARNVAGYEESFGSIPEPNEPPSVDREAARSLAQPGDYSQPPPAYDSPTAPEPDRPRMVNLGGARSGMVAPRRRRPDYGHTDDWSSEAATDPISRTRDIEPVTERRRRARIADRNNVVPTANIVAGAICALVSLAAIGYMVYALL